MQERPTGSWLRTKHASNSSGRTFQVPPGPAINRVASAVFHHRVRDRVKNKWHTIHVAAPDLAFHLF